MNLTLLFSFFFNDTATTEIYTLSLHDALPISSLAAAPARSFPRLLRRPTVKRQRQRLPRTWTNSPDGGASPPPRPSRRQGPVPASARECRTAARSHF